MYSYYCVQGTFRLNTTHSLQVNDYHLHQKHYGIEFNSAISIIQLTSDTDFSPLENVRERIITQLKNPIQVGRITTYKYQFGHKSIVYRELILPV